MTQEEMLNIASVFVMNHQDMFIEDYATDRMMFGMDSEEAFKDGEKIYSEFVEHIIKQC
jgi:hypothetical protein